MYFLVILFFASLFGIIFMIWRKLALLNNGQATSAGEVIFEIAHIEKIKHLILENAKKNGHLALVATLRFYIRTSNLLKNKYQEAKTKVRNLGNKGANGELTEKKEASKFLEMISDYKHKIRHIKRKIKEEEGIE